jgi:hypothetical protein
VKDVNPRSVRLDTFQSDIQADIPLIRRGGVPSQAEEIRTGSSEEGFGLFHKIREIFILCIGCQVHLPVFQSGNQVQLPLPWIPPRPEARLLAQQLIE